MKRLYAVLATALGVGLSAGWIQAQDEAARAAAVADQQAAEERYQRLDTAVQGLLAAQADRDRRMEALAEEIRKAALERPPAPRVEGNFVSREEFSQLVESVREIDRKREADKRQILEEIAGLQTKLEKSVREAILSAQRRAQPAPAPERTERSQPAEAKPGPGGANQEGVEYVVEKGNTLTAIVSAHNEVFKKQGKKTSVDLVLKANPKLKPEALYIGQKIWIPVVPR